MLRCSKKRASVSADLSRLSLENDATEGKALAAAVPSCTHSARDVVCPLDFSNSTRVDSHEEVDECAMTFPQIAWPEDSDDEEITEQTNQASRRRDAAPTEDKISDGAPDAKRRRLLTRTDPSSDLLGLLGTDPLEPASVTPASSLQEILLRSTPSLSEQQQVLAEYSLPIVLPALFLGFKCTRMGHQWVAVLVLGHITETLVTNFGPVTKKYRYAPVLTPLQHHFCDCVWLHTLITPMLVAPRAFGPVSSMLGIALILTLPVYLAVSFKSHYLNLVSSILQGQDKASQPQLGTSAVAQIAKRVVEATNNKKEQTMLGHVLVQCFQWYLMSIFILVLVVVVGEEESSYPIARQIFLWSGISVFNVTPWILFNSYKLAGFWSLPSP